MADSEFALKTVWDPVHGHVSVSRAELGVMNSPAFRRLHGIRQVSHLDLVYPTATHTQYEHALGTMHAAGKVCDRLGVGADVKRLARLAALLHGVGHGPFPRAFDAALEGAGARIPRARGERVHEAVGRMLVTGDPDIAGCLGDMGRDIAAVLGGGGGEGGRLALASEIVFGGLGACGMDRFERDSRNLGLSYGPVGTECVLHALCEGGDGARVGMRAGGAAVVDAYFTAWRMAWGQVYGHRARVAADQMLVRAARAAFGEGVLDLRDFDARSGSLLGTYRELDDPALVHRIMWNGGGGLSREILGDIRGRRLLKACYERHGAGDGADLRSAAEEARGRLGLQEHELFAHESGMRDLPCRGRGTGVAGVRADERDMPPSPAAPASHYVFGRADMREEIARELARAGVAAPPSS